MDRNFLYFKNFLRDRIAMGILYACKQWFHIYYLQQSLLNIWTLLLLLLFGIVTFQAFFFHSSLFFLALPPALKKDDEPSLTCMHKRNLHFILHYLTLKLIKKSKQPSSSSSFSQKRHRYFLFQYHKNFQLVVRLKGDALSLLQTQYAKKKRNPE